MRKLVIVVLLAAAAVAWAYYERRPITRQLDNLAAWVKAQAK
jgi:cell division protein FtsL